jgi:phenylacetate-CoA oxygenase PaaH subunit
MSERWEVFGKRTAADTWQAVGAVQAPDEQMALLFATEAFFRHGEGVDLAVVRTRDFHVLGDPDLLRFHTDKTYKLQAGYPLGDKRRRATRRATEFGTVVDRRRPADRRLRSGEQQPSEDAER